MMTKLQPAEAYRACVDPLHRNTWPIRVGDDETVIGYLTEHITVALDGAEPPVTRWSWTLDNAEGERLDVDVSLRRGKPKYQTWQGALDVFVILHQLAVALRSAEVTS